MNCCTCKSPKQKKSSYIGSERIECDCICHVHWGVMHLDRIARQVKRRDALGLRSRVKNEYPWTDV